MRKKSNKKRTYKKKLPKKSRKLKKPKYKKNAGTLKKILSRRIKTEPPNPNTLILNPYFDPNNPKPDDIIMTQSELDRKEVTKEKLRALEERYNNPQIRRKIYSKVNEFNPKGIDSEDIADVMEMAGVQKGKAVQALRQNYLDPELAIIKLNKIGLDPDDIKVVMDEARVTEFEAAYYLKKHNGNYLNAITEAMSN
jgi:NACalpha-BTF3-like transcription factor